jgi:hypothetical protein
MDEYDGSDLIILIGVPGSRWSNVHRRICEHPDVNTTDWSEDRSWNTPTLDVHGDLKSTGGHRGSYWGPGNLFGEGFEYMHALSKQQILAEFMRAYDDWTGVKVIKSHWFAYNIPYLRNMFPKAKILCCYVNDVDSFFWWYHSGGWGLGYANYAWYENNVKMFEKIKEENYNILKYNIDRDINFKFYKRSELWGSLGLSKDPEVRGCSIAELEGDPLVKVKMAVCDGTYINNFYHLVHSESVVLRKDYSVVEPVGGYDKANK